MANTRTLTSANAILLISVAGLYDVAQRIQGFSADDITDTDAVEPKETMMGVDGRLSAGWVPVIIKQNITLQADSLSNDLFENWAASERTSRETYVASGGLIIPSTGRKYAMRRGFLKGFVTFPSLKRTAQPRRYSIDWESVTAAPN